MTAYNYAHDRVAVAVKRGELIKPDTCSMCGEKKIIMAHHNDYSKPLDIIWVCQACHMKIHRGAPISQGKLVRTIVQLPDETFEWIRHEAFEQKISIAELIRRIIDDCRHTQRHEAISRGCTIKQCLELGKDECGGCIDAARKEGER
ncbi:MAG: hypothetical protein WC749_02255 [Dehalococcoidia bacterium]